jgi:cytochrome c-type biogenesis protein CcmH/NrfF
MRALWTRLLPVLALALLGATDDVAFEARVQRVAAELRCLVCQNQSLADSHAPLALDLKNQVREQLRAGRSDADVVAYMTDRYGDFVRYRPPFNASTLLLWGGPALMALAGLALLLRGLVGRERTAAPEPEPHDRQRARTLLDGG